MKLASATVVLICSPGVAALVPSTAVSRRVAILGPSSTTSLSMSGNQNAPPGDGCGRRAALGNLARGLFGAVVLGGDAQSTSAIVADAANATAPVEEAKVATPKAAAEAEPLILRLSGKSSVKPNAPVEKAKVAAPKAAAKDEPRIIVNPLFVAAGLAAIAAVGGDSTKDGEDSPPARRTVEPTKAAVEAKAAQPKPAELAAPGEEPSPEVIAVAQEMLDSSLEAIAVAQEMLDSTRSAATSAATTASSSIPGPSNGPMKAGGWSKSKASWKTSQSSGSGMSSYLDSVADGVASEMMIESRRAASAEPEAATPSPAAPDVEPFPEAITAAQEMLDSTRSAATSAATTVSSSIPGPSNGPMKAGGWSKSKASWKTSESSGSGMSSYLDSVADGVASEMMIESRRAASAEAVRATTERLSDEVKRIVEELEDNTPPPLSPPSEMVVESASTPVRGTSIEPAAMSVTIGGRVITTTPGFVSSMSEPTASTIVQSPSVAVESVSPASTKKKGWGKSGASWKNNPPPKNGNGGYLDDLRP